MSVEKVRKVSCESLWGGTIRRPRSSTLVALGSRRAGKGERRTHTGHEYADWNTLGPAPQGNENRLAVPTVVSFGSRRQVQSLFPVVLREAAGEHRTELVGDGDGCRRVMRGSRFDSVSVVGSFQ